MTVPEAAVDENDSAVSWKNDVWPAGQLLGVEPEAEPLPVQGAADQPLRSSIRASDAAHHAAACGRINDVSHGLHG